MLVPERVAQIRPSASCSEDHERICGGRRFPILQNPLDRNSHGIRANSRPSRERPHPSTTMAVRVRMTIGTERAAPGRSFVSHGRSCGAEKSRATKNHGQREHLYEHGRPRTSRCGKAPGARRAPRHSGAAARVDGDRHQTAVSGRRVRVDVQLLHPCAASCRRGSLQPHRGRAGRAHVSVNPGALRAGRDHADRCTAARPALDGSEPRRGVRLGDTQIEARDRGTRLRIEAKTGCAGRRPEAPDGSARAASSNVPGSGRTGWESGRSPGGCRMPTRVPAGETAVACVNRAARP